MHPKNTASNDLTASMLAGRNIVLQQLQQFRKNPTVIVPYLKQRISRYKQFEGSWFLFSKKYRKKAIQVHQRSRIDDRIRQLIGVLLRETQRMSVLEPVPKLDQIASKLCQTIAPQINKEIEFKPQTSKVLRQLLQQDHHIEYPNSVVCLISIGFDEPYESLGNLLIDDGVMSRSNRRALLNPMMKYVGVASIKSTIQKGIRCTVIVQTDSIVFKNNHPVNTDNPSNSQQMLSSQTYSLQNRTPDTRMGLSDTLHLQPLANQSKDKLQNYPIESSLRASHQSIETGRFPSEVKNMPQGMQAHQPMKGQHFQNSNPVGIKSMTGSGSNQQPSTPVPNYQSFGNNQSNQNGAIQSNVPTLQKYRSVNTNLSNQINPQRSSIPTPTLDPPIQTLQPQNLRPQQSVEFKESSNAQKNYNYYPFSGIAVDNSASISGNYTANQNQKINVHIGNASINQYMNNSVDPFANTTHLQNGHQNNKQMQSQSTPKQSHRFEN